MNPSYNDSFGSFGSGSPMPPGPIVSGPVAPEPMRSGAGDRKKWWVFLIVILIFVAVGGMVFALWKGGVFGGGDVMGEDLRVAFNRYANYLLIGEAKDENIEAFGESDENYFEKKLYSYKWDSDYAQKLEDYYDIFYKIGEKEWRDNEFGLQLLDDYSTKFELVMKFYGKTTVTQKALLGAYISGGVDQANEELTNLLLPYSGIGDVYGLNYYDVASKYGKSMIDTIANYDELGCISNGEIDYSCVSERENDVTRELSRISSVYYYDMMAIPENSARDLLKDVFKLKRMVYSEDEE